MNNLNKSNALEKSDKKIPICVDLDGTFLKSDLLYESFLKLLKSNPVNSIVALLVLVAKGIAPFKDYLAKRVSLNFETLPYNQELISWLKAKVSEGHQVYLVTASNQSFANEVNKVFPFFTDAFGSSESLNLKGKKKAEFLRLKFGEESFIYAGDSSADLPVWNISNQAVVVGSSAKKLSKIIASNGNVLTFPQSGFLKQLVIQLRPKQWVKNILVFAPIVMAHTLNDFSALLASFLAFISFCCIASSTYIVNDLLDLESDREHRSKKNRPLASGSLSIISAITVSLLLASVSIGICSFLPYEFALSLLVYLAITLSYSFYFKRVISMDVVCLSCLYTLRAVAGGLASETFLSHWFLMFSLFLFTSLACLKRCTELLSVKHVPNNKKLSGRGYQLSDLNQVALFGGATAYISVLVLALFIGSGDVLKLYTRPQMLWLLCPVLLYWTNRMWILCFREEVDDDPIVFALKDKASYYCGSLVLLLIFLAS